MTPANGLEGGAFILFEASLKKGVNSCINRNGPSQENRQKVGEGRDTFVYISKVVCFGSHGQRGGGLFCRFFVCLFQDSCCLIYPLISAHIFESFFSHWIFCCPPVFSQLF